LKSIEKIPHEVSGMAIRKVPKTGAEQGQGAPEVDLSALAAEVARQGPVLASALPAEFEAQITRVEVRKDKQGREAIFLTLEGDFGVTIEKYGKMQTALLRKCLEKLGYIWESLPNAVPTKLMVWRKYQLTAREFPRHYPVKEV
jgi:hypothetical protein